MAAADAAAEAVLLECGARPPAVAQQPEKPRETKSVHELLAELRMGDKTGASETVADVGQDGVEEKGTQGDTGGEQEDALLS